MMRSYQFQFPAAEVPPISNAPGSKAGSWMPVVAYAVASAVAGSGVLNLYSLLGGGEPPSAQLVWLHRLFPLDFVGVSRTATLLLGFALILAAAHLWASKKRAWEAALVLAGFSAVFHLTKGWDVEEAVCSIIVCALLWFTRRSFVVGSERPRLAAAMVRAAYALGIAGIYGTVGFWLLEPSEFHWNFHWWDAALRTFRIMLFLGDDTLIPHTAYGAWFLNSLFWISAAAFFYSGLILFQPAVYRFRQNSTDSLLAQAITVKHGRSGQDFFKHWPDKSYFFSANRQSFLGYRVAGNYALVLGDPVGPQSELRGVTVEFMEFCRARGWRVGFHQVSEDSLPLYESLGFHRLKVGDDAIVNLTGYSLGGSAMKEFRNTVNRLERIGYHVERIDPPLATALVADLKNISDQWLEIPGHRERQFTLGRFEQWYVEATPVYVAFDASHKAVAFLNLVPSYDPALATVDLMRRSPEAINGIMDYLIVKVFLDLKSRGIERFSLGMAPLTDCNEHSPISQDERVVYWAMKRMPFLFRADGLRRFKAKYAHSWKPRYAVYQGRMDLPRLALALWRICELPDEKTAKAA